MRVLAYAVLAGAVSIGAVEAQELKEPCKVGQRLTDRQNRTGVVVQTKSTECQLEFADGTKHWYIFWMLRPAGAPQVDTKAVVSVKPGRYVCYTGTTYGFDIHIRSATQYSGAGSGGQYQYDAASQAITFTTGSMVGTYAKYMSEGKIGLSSRPTGAFNTVCNFKP